MYQWFIELWKYKAAMKFKNAPLHSRSKRGLILYVSMIESVIDECSSIPLFVHSDEKLMHGISGLFFGLCSVILSGDEG